MGPSLVLGDHEVLGSHEIEHILLHTARPWELWGQRGRSSWTPP